MNTVNMSSLTEGEVTLFLNLDVDTRIVPGWQEWVEVRFFNQNIVESEAPTLLR